MEQDIQEVLLGEEALRERIAALGAQLARDYAGVVPLFVCVLRGAVPFLVDLTRCTSIPLEVDYMAVSSYGTAITTSGVVRILKDLDTPITGRHVVIVEDIVDSGLTLAYVRDHLLRRDPASLRICALLRKACHREAEVLLDYVGFDIPDRFVVGYGLDYRQLYRNLPYVGVLRNDALQC